MTTLKDQLDSCQTQNRMLSEERLVLQTQLASLTHARIQLYLSYATGPLSSMFKSKSTARTCMRS
jgi:hypothetical protein